ncbi:tryptophan--tRNA ligase [bacterium]|nr:tryptophan--tRNA ligase [bacterium]
MQRLLTGLQPSGALHIGNYFGALKPFADMYGSYESYLMVVDYHALTSLKNGDELRTNIRNVVRDYLAVGIDPSKATIFQQSQVQEHTELAWILECLVSVSFLELGHAYKDKVAKGLEPNAGLFTYPMLMAADILLYDTDVVPVGEDQRQHLEYAREAASKFNIAFGETLKEPKELIQKSVAIVPGTDGKKMSKSYGNTIPLFGTKDEITKAVMSIVTDSAGDRPENVYAIHKLLKTEAELAPLYEANKGKYKALKDALIEDLEAFIAPMREKRNAISDEEVKKVLDEGSTKAREKAASKMKEIRAKVGVSL